MEVEKTEKEKSLICGEKRFALKVISGLAAAVVFLAFLAIFIQLGLQGAVTDEIDRKQIAGVPDDLKALRQSEEKVLNQYRWIDKEAGSVSIPIKKAMALIVKENRALGNE